MFLQICCQFPNVHLSTIRSIGIILQVGKISIIASAKCNYVTGSLWECLRVVEPESQGGQIPEMTGPTHWPIRCTREHLRVLETRLEAPVASLKAPRITVGRSGRNNNFFGNATGASVLRG